VKKPATAKANREPASRPVPSPRRLLVVEDDPAIREAFAELLEFEGFAVATACDGNEALDRLRHGPLPELVLLDMMMPNLDGNGVLRALQAEPRWAKLRVLVVSATELAAPRGVAGFVKKPFDPDALMKLIRRTLGDSPA
jgi:sigma-B regulation protein RsbU (phosphoserine phosphatase)